MPSPFRRSTWRESRSEPSADPATLAKTQRALIRLFVRVLRCCQLLRARKTLWVQQYH